MYREDGKFDKWLEKRAGWCTYDTIGKRCHPNYLYCL
jgi:hypothetical protein